MRPPLLLGRFWLPALEMALIAQTLPIFWHFPKNSACIRLIRVVRVLLFRGGSMTIPVQIGDIRH